MLTTFVIGLREGLEASLIVGIIAAFLKRNGRASALRQMWIGVGLAEGICLAVGVVLAVVSAHLPQREQEMLESVIAGVALLMISYMILWMNAHSRGLKGELESAAAGALARGSATALVAMASLAVLREGFETSVFLLAAFDNSISPVNSVAGVLLGIACAMVLGYLIYRGGTRLNLSRFFRVTGIVLVLVAAGLVMSALRSAHEAAWLTVGQQSVLDLSWLVRPGSVQASVLGGILGIQAHPVVVEVAAWLLYTVPMLAVELWPRSRRLTKPAAARWLTVAGVAGLLVAVLLMTLVPSAQLPAAQNDSLASVGVGSAKSLQANGTAVNQSFVGSTSVQVKGVTDAVLTVGIAASATAGGVRVSAAGTVGLALAGHEGIAGLDTAEYTGSPVTAATEPDGAAATVTGSQVRQLNGGRLPIGLTGADVDLAMVASYLDSWRATVYYDSATGVVLDAQVRFVRTLQVVNSTGLAISAGVIVDVTTSLTDTARATQAAAISGVAARQSDRQIWGQVVPTLVALAALIALLGAAALGRRRPAARLPGPPAHVPQVVQTR